MSKKLDDKTLEAIGKALLAKGKIDKVDYESQTFKKALAKELKAFGKDFNDELGGWRKAIFGI